MRQNNFEYWYSKEKKFDSLDIISFFEKNENIKLPNKYKELVRYRDGGILKRNIFVYKDNDMINENCIGYFLCWQKDVLETENIIDEINNPPEFFPKGLIPFAPDGGGNYICFDYRNCKENPSIVFWHHEIEKNEGVFFLENSFEEFINNLKESHNF